MSWTINVTIERHIVARPVTTDRYTVEIEPHRNILDVIEKIWAEQDRTLTFRHGCHHASCGSCAIVANGREVLPCIVHVEDTVKKDGGTLALGPLRNFPVIADLVVDMEPLFAVMEKAGMPIVGPADPLPGQPEDDYNAFENCIECGICMSACPVVATDSEYMGPAGLAAVYQSINHTADASERSRLLDMVDTPSGIWRCHVAYECSELCPSNVDPAGKIMTLRRMATFRRIRRLLGIKEKKEATHGIDTTPVKQ
ncbi:MAG: succinate dehydrogenase/fumarate reductase iron-sulfur subunit [Chloroflexi bacterium]|nr:succinate dehydrogenase/fumarate reductase iron-sulfur subunit [Chloroflexota bacterium]